ncbi:VENN motif pre-toxin domain-containing protein, partial [Gilliamella sp. Bif1-4]
NHIDRIRAESKAKEAVEKEKEKSKNKGLTEEEQQKIYEDAYKKAMNEGMSAMGSDTRQGIDMAVSLINGLISGDMTGAAAGALAPKIATIIKQHTEGDIVANTVSHAILGAVVAELQGNSALVGGLGAAASERGAEVIMGILYPGKTVAELSQEERQQISALSQLATGLAIAAAGGDIQDVNTGVAAGKNAVENNYLNVSEDKKRKDAQAQLDLIEKGIMIVSDDRKQELQGQVAVLNALDEQRNEILNTVCQNLSSLECSAARADLQAAYDSYFKTIKPEDYIAYNDAYSNYTKYYDGYKQILSQINKLEGQDLAAFNEYKAQNLSEGLGISIESARNLIKFDNAMHSAAIIASAVVGQNSVKSAGKGTTLPNGYTSQGAN